MLTKNMKFVIEGTENMKFIPVEIVQFREIELKLPSIDISKYPAPTAVIDYSVGGHYNAS